MDDISDTQARDDLSASDSKRRTWPAGVPPLRLNRRTTRYDRRKSSDAPTYDSTPPAHLRALRAFIGVALLALAWVGLLAVVVVGQMLWRRATSQRPLSFHLSLYILSLAATCWVAIVAIACIVAGAFSLALAVTRRGW